MEIETTLSNAWDQHIASEFAAKSAEQALATMTAEPYVNEVPLMIGARERHHFPFSLQAPGRRHAGAVPDVRKNRIRAASLAKQSDGEPFSILEGKAAAHLSTFTFRNRSSMG